MTEETAPCSDMLLLCVQSMHAVRHVQARAGNGRTCVLDLGRLTKVRRNVSHCRSQGLITPRSCQRRTLPNPMHVACMGVGFAYCHCATQVGLWPCPPTAVPPLCVSFCSCPPSVVIVPPMLSLCVFFQRRCACTHARGLGVNPGARLLLLILLGHFHNDPRGKLLQAVVHSRSLQDMRCPKRPCMPASTQRQPAFSPGSFPL